MNLTKLKIDKEINQILKNLQWKSIDYKISELEHELAFYKEITDDLYPIKKEKIEAFEEVIEKLKKEKDKNRNVNETHFTFFKKQYDYLQMQKGILNTIPLGLIIFVSIFLIIFFEFIGVLFISIFISCLIYGLYTLGFLLKNTDKAIIYMTLVTSATIFLLNIMNSNTPFIDKSIKNKIDNLDLKILEINSTKPIEKVYLNNLINKKDELQNRYIDQLNFKIDYINLWKKKQMILALTITFFVLYLLIITDIIKTIEENNMKKQKKLTWREKRQLHKCYNNN